MCEILGPTSDHPELICELESGPYMLLLYVIAWCLNNMQIVCCWCNALGSSKMDCRIVY